MVIKMYLFTTWHLMLLMITMATLPTTMYCEEDDDDDDDFDPNMLPNRTTNIFFMEYEEYVPYYKPNGNGIIQRIILNEISRHEENKKTEVLTRKKVFPLWQAKQGMTFKNSNEMLALIQEQNRTKIFEILNSTDNTPDLFFIGATTMLYPVGTHFHMVNVIKTQTAVLMVSTEEILLLVKFIDGIKNCLGVTFFAVCAAIDLAAVIWLIESRTNPDFKNSFGAGLWSSFWYCFVTMTTVGYGDKVPKHFVSRLLCLAWMLFGLMLTGIITTTVMEAVQSGYDTNGKVIGVVRNTSEAEIVKTKLNGEPMYFDHYEDMYQATMNEEVNALLCEATVAATNFDNEDLLSIVAEYNLPSYVNAYFIGGGREHSIFDINFDRRPIDSTSANKVKSKLTPPYQVILYRARDVFTLFDQRDDGIVLYTSIVAGAMVIFGIASEVFAYFNNESEKKKSFEDQKRQARALKDYQISPNMKKLVKIEENLLKIIDEVNELKSSPSISSGVTNEAFTKI